MAEKYSWLYICMSVAFCIIKILTFMNKVMEQKGKIYNDIIDNPINFTVKYFVYLKKKFIFLP